MRGEQQWPDTIWIVRHGESAGNVARELAESAEIPMIELATRDADVPLSLAGEEQADALGRWFGAMQTDLRPTSALTSPYVRARSTAERVIRSGGMDPADLCLIEDERLREKEFGILDRLTQFGIHARFPDQAEFRRALGKFYHRPPGGESWCDVILRLRSVIDTLTRDYCGERVLIVCHTVVVLCFRYLLECMTEAEVLSIDRQQRLANCSVTSYEFNGSAGRNGKMELKLFNFVAPLAAAGAEITTEPDAPVAPK